MADRNPDQAGNIALLIDADNASSDHLDAVLTVLAELGTVNIRRAYGDWASAGLKNWKEQLHAFGFSVPGVSASRVWTDEPYVTIASWSPSPI